MTEIRIGDLQVDVIRKDIRSLRLTVYAADSRVRVSVPTRTSNQAIIEFVYARRVWIRKYQEKFTAQKRPVDMTYVTGEMHYFQGVGYLLQVHSSKGAPRVICQQDRVLALHTREGSTREQRQKLLAAWYRAQLKEQLPALAAHWQLIVGAQAQEWGIKQMKTCWGTCNVRARRIWLNLELMKKPVACLEYVMVHELVHLHERLHNARFWRLMDQFMPEWRAYRAELNKLPNEHATGLKAC